MCVSSGAPVRGPAPAATIPPFNVLPTNPLLPAQAGPGLKQRAAYARTMVYTLGPVARPP